MKRRHFLKGCCLAAGAGALPATFFVTPRAFGQTASHDVLVYLFLRGGIDGLHLVVPYSGPERVAYENARGNMRIPVERLRPIGGGWALHPRAGGGPGDAVDSDPKWLQRLWLQEKLAIVQGVGMRRRCRAAISMHRPWMDLGTPGTKATSDGWLKRYLEQATGLPAPLLSHVMGFSSTQPMSLLGSDDAFTVSRAEEFRVDGFHWSWNQSNPDIAGHQGARHLISPLWQSVRTPLEEAGGLTAEALELMREMDFAGYQPEGGAQYPDSNLGGQMRNLAQTDQERPRTGCRDAGLRRLGHSPGTGVAQSRQCRPLRLLWKPGTGPFRGHRRLLYRPVPVRCRKPDEPGSVSWYSASSGATCRATSHSEPTTVTATSCWLWGGRVIGRQFYGEFPGLDSNSLFEGQDLDTSTDFRQVLAEALVRRMGFSAGQLDTVFPAMGSYQPLGLFES
jgi:hypothetical protein